MVVGIGSSDGEIELLALKLQCKTDKLPLLYLDLPIGGMWILVVGNSKKMLSAWKRN